MEVSFIIPIKKYLVRFLELDPPKYHGKWTDRTYFYAIYMIFKTNGYNQMFGMRTLFEIYTGYLIDKTSFNDSFKEKTLFKSLQNSGKKNLFMIDLSSRRQDLKFTFKINSIRKIQSISSFEKESIINKINRKLDKEFWNFACNSITMIQLDKYNTNCDHAIKIFYNDLNISVNEYDPTCFKRMLYKHGFKSLKKMNFRNSHFISNTKNSILDTCRSSKI